MVTSEIQGESQPVRTPLRCEWPFLMMTTYFFPTLDCGTGCLDCCDHQYWMLEEKAPSFCPGLVLSVVSLQAAVLKWGAGVTAWTRDHVTYDKPQLDQEEPWVN